MTRQCTDLWDTGGQARNLVCGHTIMSGCIFSPMASTPLTASDDKTARLKGIQRQASEPRRFTGHVEAERPLHPTQDRHRQRRQDKNTWYNHHTLNYWLASARFSDEERAQYNITGISISFAQVTNSLLTLTGDGLVGNRSYEEETKLSGGQHGPLKVYN